VAYINHGTGLMMTDNDSGQKKEEDQAKDDKTHFSYCDNNQMAHINLDIGSAGQ
jgi:hypothetical protein